MILSGCSIEDEVSKNRIKISPFFKERITTNSYDLTLGDTFLKYTEEVLDPRKNNSFETFQVGSEGLLLNRGEFVLGHSAEKIGSDCFVPLIHAKSGTARLGLFVHVTADLIDIGFYGNANFQLYATLPVRIFPGMAIGQVTFWCVSGDVELYSGKYQGTKGPRASEFFKDFE